MEAFLQPFDVTTDPKILLDYYQKYQILLIRNGSRRTAAGNMEAVTLLSDMYVSFGASIDKHWSIENAGTNTNHDQLNPLSVLTSIGNHRTVKKRSRNHQQQLPHSFYVSCILQSKSNELQSQFLAACPYAVPPFFPQKNDASAVVPSPWGNVIHSAPVWLFMGRHHRSSSPLHTDEPVLKKGSRKQETATTVTDGALTGRVEHTDSVSHSGTWHHQLSGSKTWYVRPLMESKEWRNVPDFQDFSPSVSIEKSTRRSQRVESKSSSNTNTTDWRLQINCQTGDLLLINTRLWWHCTSLPLTTTTVDDESADWSISFARDFYCSQASALLVNPPSHAPVLDNSNGNSSSSSSATKERRRKRGDTEPPNEEFCNVDGIYAAKNVRKGQVASSSLVFTCFLMD